VAGDQRGEPPPDDPRLAKLVEAVERARGESDFVLWSGQLPPGREAHDQVESLMREPWGRFTGSAALAEEWTPRFDEFSEEWAVRRLTWLLGHDLAYDSELVPEAEAEEVANRFVELLPSPRRWFSNRSNVSRGWSPMTSYTYDEGVIAAGESRAYIAWFMAED
jgi:hypothetical protein